jgi:mono/diheme cytochrome c family protein
MKPIFAALCLPAVLLATAFGPAALADDGAAPSSPDAAGLYRQHCASCHGPDRLGLMGPALLPENLARLRKADAQQVVRAGRPATQMPAFAGQLGEAEIAALAEWIYTPVTPAPAWSDEAIRASRIQHVDPAMLPARPVFTADPLNLFLVVEAGDHHVSVLDGDRLEPIHRFASRFALHGGPKFTADGRYVFFASRDGWITKYDLWNLTVVAEVRAGINTRNVAVSPDGRHVAVANYLPHSLVLLDGELNLIRSLPAVDHEGRHSSRVSAVYDATPRRAFIAALKDVPEVWEISYDEAAEDIPTGYVHDYRYREGAFVPGYLNPRRSLLAEPLDDFFFNETYAELMGASREGVGQVVNLDVRRKIAELPLAGMPHLGSGITWLRDGRRVMATPHLKEPRLSVIDTESWQVLATVDTLGPGFFLRGHEASPHVWADVMLGPKRDTIQVIDKLTLEVVADLTPTPGATAAHVEFDRSGRHALVSVWEDDGALVVYDAKTLREVKRLPMRKPAGKYNVWNKISFSDGTSH